MKIQDNNMHPGYLCYKTMIFQEIFLPFDNFILKDEHTLIKQ
jgi:hypothetical protein